MTDPTQTSYGGSSSPSYGGTATELESSATSTGAQSGPMKDTVAEKAGGIVDQAKPAVDAGMDKAASGLQSAADMVRERGESMGGGQIASVATMAADKLEGGAGMLRGTDTDALIIEVENMVRRKPVESLAVAAGIGFLLSKALR